MNVRRSFFVAAMAAAVLATVGATAQAATITSINQFILPGFSTGSLTVSLPASPNNDNTATPSPNTIATGGFGIFLNADGFGILDYEFNLAESGGTTEQENVVEWSGATVNHLGAPAGGPPFSVAFSLSIDVPDGMAALHPQGVNRFTLRSFPTAQQVPEPATAALLGVALACGALRRLRLSVSRAR